jgi:hypothetical protein
MVKNTCMKQNIYHDPNEGGIMHLRGPSFFFLERGGDFGFLLFPSSKCVLYHVPNSFSVYPISFAVCSTHVT